MKEERDTTAIITPSQKGDVMIIGSGLGGLSAGSMLAENGYHVTILEQGAQIGGCLQCFSRKGARFETGMHVVGSLDEGQILSNYLNMFGVKDKITFSPLDRQAYHIISIKGRRYRFAFGHKEMIEQLATYFPQEKEHLARYWGLVDAVAQAAPYYTLTQQEGNSHPVNDLYTRSLNNVIDETIEDPLLRQVLVGDMPLYAAERDTTSFAAHAYIADFYNQSAYRVVGGSDSIAKAFADIIIQQGGDILTNRRITKANCVDGRVVSIHDAEGREYRADIFIFDIHPSQLLTIFPPSDLRRQYRERIMTQRDTTSAFSLYLRFKDGTMPYMNSNFFGYRASPWDLDNYNDDNWPRGYLYMHHCHEEHPQYAQSGVVMAYMSADELKEWTKTGVGHRGSDYETYKKRKAEQLLDAVAEDFPDIRQAIESYYTSTPLTYRDYTMTPGGTMYGIIKDINLGILGRITYRTKIPNLYLVGQNINAHGILGVLIGSVNVCRHILGAETIEKQMMERNGIKAPSTIVIGGGLGGLITGALLAKNGHRVTLIEKNRTLGGGLQSFERNGIQYPTGMHVFGGFKQGWQLDQLCRYLGIIEKVGVAATDSDCFDEIISVDGRHHYRLPQGRENYTCYLTSLFPHEAEGIREYVEALYRISEEESLFYLRPEGTAIPEYSEQFLWPADRLIAHYIKDPDLRGLLSYLAPLYAGISGETPAYEHALINILHIEGSSMFTHGGQRMADALAEVIVSHGGKVVTGDPVAAIRTTERSITHVETASKATYEADFYISDIDPQRLLELLPQKAFPASYRNRIAEAQYGYSCFKLYIHLTPNTIPHKKHPCYYACDNKTRHAWNAADISMDQWPRCFMAVTEAGQDNPEYAQTITLVVPTPYEWFSQWKETQRGHRGKEYQQLKDRLRNRLIDLLTTHYPTLRESIVHTYSSTPLTIADYYGNSKGSLFGFHTDCNHIMYTKLSVNTKVRNLFLTGQNVNLHGMCGVAITAIMTAEAILGNGTITNQLHPIK